MAVLAFDMTVFEQDSVFALIFRPAYSLCLPHIESTADFFLGT